MEKFGIIVYCKQCRYLAQGETGEFDISVPVKDMQTSEVGEANLCCKVTAQQHQVKFNSWSNQSGQITPSQNQQQRLLNTLDYVAKQCICGNQHICPHEIVDIVAKVNQS